MHKTLRSRTSQYEYANYLGEIYPIRAAKLLEEAQGFAAPQAPGHGQASRRHWRRVPGWKYSFEKVIFKGQVLLFASGVKDCSRVPQFRRMHSPWLALCKCNGGSVFVSSSCSLLLFVRMLHVGFIVLCAGPSAVFRLFRV